MIDNLLLQFYRLTCLVFMHNIALKIVKYNSNQILQRQWGSGVYVSNSKALAKFRTSDYNFSAVIKENVTCKTNNDSAHWTSCLASGTKIYPFSRRLFIYFEKSSNFFAGGLMLTDLYYHHVWKKIWIYFWVNCMSLLG